MVFNTRVNVYFQGNRNCSFLPGCACRYFCIDLLISCALKINDNEDNDILHLMIIKIKIPVNPVKPEMPLTPCCPLIPDCPSWPLNPGDPTAPMDPVNPIAPVSPGAPGCPG